MTGDGIYLAGPVENDDDPGNWRDLVKSLFPDVEFADPMDWQEQWHEDPEAVIAKELDVCETHPILACNVGSDAPETVGTHHEIAHALANGNDRIAVVAEGDVAGFVEHRVDVFENVREAIDALQRKPVAADGGENGGD